MRELLLPEGDAAVARHREIEQDEARLVLVRQSHRVRRVVGREHAVAVKAEHQADGVGRVLVVVDQQ